MAAVARDELDARLGRAALRHEAHARATLEAPWRRPERLARSWPSESAPCGRDAPIVGEGEQLRLHERQISLGGERRRRLVGLGGGAGANPARERERHQKGERDSQGSPTKHGSSVLRFAAQGARYP